MRIGLVLQLNPTAGGIYQYSLAILCALADWKTDDELVVITTNSECTIPSHAGVGWELRSLEPKVEKKNALNSIRRAVGEGPHREAWRMLRKKIGKTLGRSQNSVDLNTIRVRPELKGQFEAWKLDLLLYAWPFSMSFEAGIPFVMAVHDLQHRLHPEFPEVSADGEWESREYCLRNGARFAALLLADSEVGREDIVEYYGSQGVTAERVKVLPFLPASYLDENVSESERKRVRVKYSLPERYLFYPAQFWPHKNHVRIVEALTLLKEARQLSVPIVFSGSQSGKLREDTFRQMMSISSTSGLGQQVRYIGYVPDQDISGIYAESAGLVMPTFFGPTNIPILEAWAYGCPVLTSDIRGIREQVADAAILVDPTSVPALADGIYRLWTDEELRRSLAERGARRLAQYTPADFRGRLIEILEEAKVRIRQGVHHRQASEASLCNNTYK